MSMTCVSVELIGLRAALDLMESAAYVKDTEGRYLFANKSVCNLFGRALADIVGKDDSHFFDLQRSHELKDNDAHVMKGDEIVAHEERNIIKATGAERIYLTVKMPLQDALGSVVGMCEVSTDITNQPPRPNN